MQTIPLSLSFTAVAFVFPVFIGWNELWQRIFHAVWLNTWPNTDASVLCLDKFSNICFIYVFFVLLSVSYFDSLDILESDFTE